MNSPPESLLDRPGPNQNASQQLRRAFTSTATSHVGCCFGPTICDATARVRCMARTRSEIASMGRADTDHDGGIDPDNFPASAGRPALVHWIVGSRRPWSGSNPQRRAWKNAVATFMRASGEDVFHYVGVDCLGGRPLWRRRDIVFGNVLLGLSALLWTCEESGPSRGGWTTSAEPGTLEAA